MLPTACSRIRRIAGALVFGAGLIMALPHGAAAMLIVDAVVSANGSSFDYDITITNGLADDVILISLIDAPVGDLLTSSTIQAAPGFAALYDAGLGILDLAENTLLFGAGQTVSGFSFSSASAPGPGVFANFEAITTSFDLVLGSLQVTAVPEPNLAVVLGVGLLAGLGARLRRSRALLVSLVISFGAGGAMAASHSDAPLIKQDPQANITDVYAFIGTKFGDPNTPVLNVVTAVRPFSEPGDGPHYDRFADDARYSIHLTNPATGETVLRYDFQFSAVAPSGSPGLKNPDSLLSFGLGTELGPILMLGDERQNYTQTYTVNLEDVSAGTTHTLGTGLPTAPPNVGPRTTPDYNDANGLPISGAATAAQLDTYTRDAISDLANGGVAFAGSRDDGFFADIPGIFDLLDGRILDNDGDPGDNLGQDGNGVDAFKGFNVLTFGIQIPVAGVPTPIGLPLIGVYASVSRPRITLRSTGAAPRNLGPFVQVNRMGNPLFNEAFVPLSKKDEYNRTDPTHDQALFAGFARNPRLAVLINAVFGTNFPETGSDLLEALFIPDVLRVDLSTGPVPLAGDPGFNRLSFLGDDIVPSMTFGMMSGGFPNGRRFGDDVLDIALTVVSGDLGPLSLVGDNVPRNDQTFHRVFPFAATPHAGTTNRKDPQ